MTKADAGWVEFLYKDVGTGTHALAGRSPGETVNMIGPIGTPFAAGRSRPRTLLLGGGVGIPPMVFLADRLRADTHWKPLVLMGSEVPFPFTTRPSSILVPGMPAAVIAAMPLLEDWGIPSRLASLQGYPGCFDGYVTDLARHWLDALDESTRRQVGIYACGPHPMLEAVVNLARWYDVEPESVLRETNKRFRERFSHIERRVHEQGLDMSKMTLSQLDEYWDEAKRYSA